MSDYENYENLAFEPNGIQEEVKIHQAVNDSVMKNLTEKVSDKMTWEELCNKWLKKSKAEIITLPLQGGDDLVFFNDGSIYVDIVGEDDDILVATDLTCEEMDTIITTLNTVLERICR